MNPLNNRDLQRVGQKKCKSLLRLEYLEERVMLDATVIEDFSTKTLDAYRSIYKFYPSAEIVPGAAHDGVGNALVKHDGYEWMIRNDGAVQVHRGETISVWTKFADNVDGRIYFGFGATPNGLVHSPLSDGRTLAFVLAGNTGQLMIQGNDTSSGFKPAPRTLAAISQDYAPDQWYYMEVVWAAGGTITGNLYDDGGNLLNSVSATGSTVASGGIAFRGFGSDKYFDTVSVDDGSGGAPGQRTRFFNHHGPAVPTHPPIANVQPQPLEAGITGGDGTGSPVPWDYTSVPGTGRDVQLNGFNQLSQVSGTFNVIPGMVALAAQNVSFNAGSVQVPWGPAHYFSGSDINPESAYLAQYMFRQLPGDTTQLIGSSDLKHFWSSGMTDYQHLNPGESDTYDTGTNSLQSEFFFGSDLDPVTGDVHRYDYFSKGATDVNGFNPEQSRTFSTRLEHMLQVQIADIDPSQNPDGTRWYLMGCLWLTGDQNVDNNSRWVEVTPNLSGTNFTFSYPQGSGGQLNFRTIPGLGNAPGAGGSPGGLRSQPIGVAGLAAALLTPTNRSLQGLVGSGIIPLGPSSINDSRAVALDQHFALPSGTGATALAPAQPQENVPPLDPFGAVVQDPLQI
jgi:hypothetical protein